MEQVKNLNSMNKKMAKEAKAAVVKLPGVGDCLTVYILQNC